MLKVHIDEDVLRNPENAETKSVDFLFTSIVFFYDFLGKRPEYSKEFEIHRELFEGVINHYEESTPRLSLDQVCDLLKNISVTFQKVLGQELPISSDDTKSITDVFQDNQPRTVLSARAAFFGIVRYFDSLKKSNGSREKFFSILFYYYGQLGSSVYSLKDQFDDLIFQEKVKKVLTPSLQPEDTYFEFSIAYALKRSKVDLKFLAESNFERKPDFEIFSHGTSFGCLECTTKKQTQKSVDEHVANSLNSKDSQVSNFPGVIKCLTIHMPYELNLRRILLEKQVVVDGTKLQFLKEVGTEEELMANQAILKIISVLRGQTTFTHLLITSDHFLEFTAAGIANTSRRRMYQKNGVINFPGYWPEGIIVF